MNRIRIMLSDMNAVREFVNMAPTVDADLDLISGRTIIDAKSVIGVFSLDLSKPLYLDIHSDDADIAEKFQKFVTP